jgi:hypothetical protein
MTQKVRLPFCVLLSIPRGDGEEKDVFIFLVLEIYKLGKFKQFLKQYIRSFSDQYLSLKNLSFQCIS